MKYAPGRLLNSQRVGGIVALYLAIAYLMAIPFFLVVLNYQEVVAPAAKLELLVNHQAGLYLFNLLAYVVFGLGLSVLALALSDRLRGETPAMARVIAGWGIIWSCLLIASGTVANMGMEYVVTLQRVDAANAARAWQVIESIADALGGAGGEALGGPWVLLVSLAGLRSQRLPRALNWLGVVTGIAGLASTIPPLRESAVVFGLLQILWFAWLGIVLLRTKYGAAGGSRRGKQCSGHRVQPRRADALHPAVPATNRSALAVGLGASRDLPTPGDGLLRAVRPHRPDRAHATGGGPPNLGAGDGHGALAHRQGVQRISYRR